MKTDTREPQATESYATFWEPIVVDAPAGPTAPLPRVEDRDAYLEFVNVTEDDAPGKLHVEQI